MSNNTLSPFLRRVLFVDAIVSGATGILFVFGASLLEALLHLPESILRPAGLFLIPYSLLVAYIASRVSPPRWTIWMVIAANLLWAIDSILMLLIGWISPNLLGYAFVIAQALVVAGFAVLQFTALNQQPKGAAQSA